MEFDKQGHIIIRPDEFYDRVRTCPVRAVRDVLLAGTPVAFPTYDAYCRFLHDISSRLNVAPRNIVFRGSCHLGFSTTPKPNKAWYKMRDGIRKNEKPSDLDLAIVDAKYFAVLDAENQDWERNNPITNFRRSSDDFEKYTHRLQDRKFYFCRDENFPEVVGKHHKRTLGAAPVKECCAGVARELSAFIFRDWDAMENRYEYDLEELRSQVETRKILPPGAEPLV